MENDEHEISWFEPDPTNHRAFYAMQKRQRDRELLERLKRSGKIIDFADRAKRIREKM